MLSKTWQRDRRGQDPVTLPQPVLVCASNIQGWVQCAGRSVVCCVSRSFSSSDQVCVCYYQKLLGLGFFFWFFFFYFKLKSLNFPWELPGHESLSGHVFRTQISCFPPPSTDVIDWKGRELLNCEHRDIPLAELPRNEYK